MAVIIGTNNADILNGTFDSDTILGLGGNDTLLAQFDQTNFTFG